MSMPATSKRMLLLLIGLASLTMAILGATFLSRQRQARRLELEADLDRLAETAARQLEKKIAEPVQALLKTLRIDTSTTLKRLDHLTAQMQAMTEHPWLQFPFIIHLTRFGRLLEPRQVPARHLLAPREDYAATGLFFMIKDLDGRTTPPLFTAQGENLFISAAQAEFEDKDALEAQRRFRLAETAGNHPGFVLLCRFRAALALFKTGDRETARRQLLLAEADLERVAPPYRDPLAVFLYRSWAAQEREQRLFSRSTELYQRMLEWLARMSDERLMRSFVFFRHEALAHLGLTPSPDGLEPLEAQLADLYRSSPPRKAPASPQLQAKLLDIYQRFSQHAEFHRLLGTVARWDSERPGIKEIYDELEDKRHIVFYQTLLLEDGHSVLAGFFYLPERHDIDSHLQEITPLLASHELSLFWENKSPGDRPYPVRRLPLGNGWTRQHLILYSEFPDPLQRALNRELWIGYALLATLIALLGLFIGLLVKYQARESQLLRQKAGFIETASHTLKSPLGRISIMAEVVANEWQKDEAQKKEFLQNIVLESRQASEMIDTMLAVCQRDLSALVPRSRLRIQTLVSQVMARHAPDLSQRGFAVLIDLEEDIPPLLLDGQAIEIMLANLLSNAVKYSPRIKRIEIRAWRDEQGVGLEVKDYGTGIPALDQKRIFERYYRVDSDEVRAIEGHGLGLWLVHEIVRAHGGRIELTSEMDRGSSFVVRLPAELEQERS